MVTLIKKTITCRKSNQPVSSAELTLLASELLTEHKLAVIEAQFKPKEHTENRRNSICIKSHYFDVQ
jgi:hypothetical protein